MSEDSLSETTRRAIEDDLMTALEHCDDDEAIYHIRSALQKLQT